MRKLEVIDESRLVNNPYVYTLQIPVTEVTLKDRYKEGAHNIVVNDKLYIEKLPSTKIFLSKESKEIVYNLSDKAQRMYLYVLYNLNSNKDWIQINKEMYMAKNEIKSVNTYKDSISELIRYGFLTTTEYKTVFWINPHLFFSGNRIKKFKKHTIVVSSWDQTSL
jgi:hypothetical protein